MVEKVQMLKEEAMQALQAASNLPELDDWRVKYLGRKGGAVTQLLRSIPELPAEERPAFGQAANELKGFLQERYEARHAELSRPTVEMTEAIDVTLPGRPVNLGRLHLTIQTLREMYAIFGQMGFQVEEWPEVETDLLNFELLNMPPHHPARDMWDTFYVNPKVVLRTHTSPGQIRSMRKHCSDPIRIILPGKCYRYEAVTARSEFMFYQVEGLAVGRRITLADLKGTMVDFARQMFGADREVRFRCSYFPFTEPSVEVDMDCIICGGEGCRVCKHTGWVEICGAGMVHPQVLSNGGYDPDVYSGFAFGMGPERVAMLKHDIDDIRYFYSNDLRFLKQFG
ncbi:MAG: phenylalanine--tRNA ligase subunit alpha [Chloroflexi bacterium B3_Chlor]|nr:MAG: phenylalanine--tRNA ligase subunit alpha [Chloroflexi bacterium B3_Chlor]